MQTEPEIAFRNVEPSQTLKEQIVDHIDRLDELDDQLITCRVMVELRDHRHRRGNLYHVRIDVTRPGAEIVVDRHPPKHDAHEDIQQAVGEAFDAARKRLLEEKAKRRGEVKQHETSPTGHVRTIFPDHGYGFIEAPDGYDVYFHRNALKGVAFDRLEVGTRVRYVEEAGEEGPQASVVEAL